MRKDQVSHFILRLAYCRTGDLRAWLLTHELALFRVRFKELDVEQQVCGARAQGSQISAR